MGSVRFTFVIVISLLLCGCDLWPRQLGSLGKSLTELEYGETSVWLLGGDVLVISVVRSPIFGEPEDALGTVALRMATLSVEPAAGSIESVAMSIYKEEMSDVPGEFREFLFLVKDQQPRRIVMSSL